MSSNIVHLMEQLKLGYGVPVNEDLAYNKLKCLKKDVFYMHNEGDCPLFTSRFCPIRNYPNLLGVANEDGKLVIHDINKPTIMCRVPAVQAHNNAIFDFAWSNFDMKLLTASGDHTCRLFDISGGDIRPLLCFRGHSRSVKTIANHPDERCTFVTGGRDGLVICWDTRISNTELPLRPDITIQFPHLRPNHMIDHYDTFAARRFRKVTPHRGSCNIDTVTGLVYQDCNTLISCSAGEGVIKVWDMRKTYIQYKRLPKPKYELEHPGDSARVGFTNLAVSPCKLKLYASCKDNSIYCFNIGTYNKNPIQTYRGHNVESYYIKLAVSPCGKYLASGSSDNFAYIWSLAEPKLPLVALTGHNAEVTCIDWSRQKDLKLSTCSDDGTYLLWRVHSGDVDVKDYENEYGGHAIFLNETKKIVPSRGKKRMFYRSSYFRDEITQPIKDNGENHDPNKQILEKLISPEVTCKKRKRISDLQSTSNDSIDASAFLSDLPNYVIDGRCPHVYCSHLPKVKEEESEANWLNRISQQRLNSTSPMMAGVKRRKFSTSTRSGNNVSGNLLHYFKIASKQPQPQQHQQCNVANAVVSESAESPTPIS